MFDVTREQKLLRHEIYRRLHHDIVTCALLPGQELRENELADQFSISKSPIRDALLKLEFEGLVEVLPRRGYRVRPLVWEDAEELYDMRDLLERECARVAIARAGDADFEALRLAARIRPSDAADFLGYNRRFHIALARTSGRKQLAEASIRVISQFDRMIVLSLSQLRIVRIKDLEKGHMAMVDALQQRDAALADELIRSHVHRSKERVREALSKMEVSMLAAPPRLPARQRKAAVR
ncbi:GntR family transcriptional regulator [Xanthobacter dioxanivorans]|uniref:GntR family transcriptional regulator n=1 Tax=Xanthobacter dioxanivorans TaxID=2528964 RepID=A0A974PL40_9HYPH|nr:GntR family transcriptional regulator [Xanthobacter dioxanivorans]QRG05577.1 GntR family transcriptional regulator [Xanthobacter dioxanivorans]